MAIFGIVTDITELKRAEEALRESEGKLAAMLGSIVDHMSMLDKDLNIIWANKTAKKIFGEDIIGKKCYKAYHRREEPCESCPTLDSFKDGGIHEHDTKVIGKDGQTIWFHCTAHVALKDDRGNPTAVLEISRDITERKWAEEVIKRQDKERIEFINALIHEIKTPLTAMLASSELLREELSDSSPLYALAENLDTATHNLNRRLSELLDSAKLQSTELALHLQPVDICQLAQYVATQVTAVLQNKDQTLNLELPTSLPRVEADPDRVIQIFLNLLTNASKFSPPHSKIYFQAYPAHTHLIMEVRDCAPPIEPQRAKLIFKPYYQSKEGRTTGLGLGLSICKRLIELHGGKIWVETRSKGNSFKFSLPLEGKT
ncbi:MAG: PAS domain-containing sensor histidine kinase [Dehalococcoidia bacterium]|nr:PAS domain-containing sensor histidine kinase [Dehalococcoidia bacterium]